MKKMGLNDLRQEYLDFFEKKDHTVLKSFSLIPEKDKSLLLIGAGMAPLKEYFTGEKKMPKNRAASSQRCIRTGDIDRVGRTQRHGTYFEMLGNFSFGDYFKKEAIAWAWEFLTEVLEIDPELLSVTVYHEDDEAFNIWHEDINLPKERIFRLGKEDNFWELEEGPCGPCSEIFVDRGMDYACGDPNCGPACDCDRFMEVWNLVFTQFNKTKEGDYVPLKHPNIDTGMGLERITLIMEGVDNIFEIQLMRGIIGVIESLSGRQYKEDENADVSMRIISDHVKAMTFLVYDGVIPSNEGRGYVLRRLIRRAYRHGKLLGIEGNFLTTIIEEVISAYAQGYPELGESKDRIFKIILAEENKFQETIDMGLHILEEMIRDLEAKDEKILSGKDAFRLYDTYGFPLDLTDDILSETDLSVDTEGFEREMEEQKNRSRQARTVDGGFERTLDLPLEDYDRTTFLGYQTLTSIATVIGAFADNAQVNELTEGQRGIILLNQSPFYGEGGGQVGDRGIMEGEGVKIEVVNTTKTKEEVIVHHVIVHEGVVVTGDELEASVDRMRRKDIMKNHSATHLLHKALREVLGEHIQQKGSFVDANRLRFDITHFEAITHEELSEVERKVNEQIALGLPVIVEEMDQAESLNSGAIGLFEDKYKDVVRVVSMGDYSKELCGGTHVKNTSDIMMFKIMSEASVAAGVRRIEAITGRGCYQHLLNIEGLLTDTATELKTTVPEIFEKVRQLQDRNKTLKQEIEALQNSIQLGKVDDIANHAVDVMGVPIVVERFEGVDMDGLRSLGDKMKDKLESCVFVAGSVVDGKLLFLVMVTKDLVKRGLHAGNLVRKVAQYTGGNGGGRPDSASAGGKDMSKLGEALAKVTTWIEEDLA